MTNSRRPLPRCFPCRSLRRRFKLSAGGKVLYPRPGHVHKRFNKTKRQLFDLSGKQALTPAYAKVLRKLGFALRRF
jgi:ribosomal protein L35